MTEEFSAITGKKSRKGFSGSQVIGMIFGSMLITMIVTAIGIKMFLFPSPFKPVELSAKEEKRLEQKLSFFEGFGSAQAAVVDKNRITNGAANGVTGSTGLQPEKYSEEGAERHISFTERELNAMIAKNTDLADKLAVDLAEDMVSIKLLIPLDTDVPMLGGKTLKIKAGAELAYRNGRPVVKLRGVSMMGVPIPNAWLGGLKNIDLISEFGADEGFWQTFADGVDSIGVEEGFLNIQLKE